MLFCIVCCWFWLLRMDLVEAWKYIQQLFRDKHVITWLVSYVKLTVYRLNSKILCPIFSNGIKADGVPA